MRQHSNNHHPEEKIRLERIESIAGWTLVELLTVIAIVAVLVALLIPAVGNIRKKVESVQCVSNLRQYGMEFTRYLNDEGNRMVPIAWANKDQTEAFGLPYQGAFMDYFHGKLPKGYSHVAGCPTQRRNKSLIWSKVSSGPPLSQRRTYGLNGLATTDGTVANPRSIANYSSPGATMIIGDGDNSDYSGQAAYYNGGLNTVRIPEPVHDNRANMLFLDGHVETRHRDDIPTTAESKVKGTKDRMFWYGTYD